MICMPELLPDQVRQVLITQDHDNITKEDCVTIRLSKDSGTEQQNIVNLVDPMQAQHFSPENWNNVTNMIDGDPSQLNLDDATNVAQYYRLLLLLIHKARLNIDDLSLFHAMTTADNLTTHRYKRS
jgi:hypothetical protein